LGFRSVRQCALDDGAFGWPSGNPNRGGRDRGRGARAVDSHPGQRPRGLGRATHRHRARRQAHGVRDRGPDADLPRRPDRRSSATEQADRGWGRARGVHPAGVGTCRASWGSGSGGPWRRLERCSRCSPGGIATARGRCSPRPRVSTSWKTQGTGEPYGSVRSATASWTGLARGTARFRRWPILSPHRCGRPAVARKRRIWVTRFTPGSPQSSMMRTTRISLPRCHTIP
jgi:hypothetical protein